MIKMPNNAVEADCESRRLTGLLRWVAGNVEPQFELWKSRGLQAREVNNGHGFLYA